MVWHRCHITVTANAHTCFVAILAKGPTPVDMFPIHGSFMEGNTLL